VGVVTIHYHNSADLVCFLESLDRARMPEEATRKVVVVNNGGNVQKLNGAFVVQPETNLGYINGCHLGIERFADLYGGHPKWWVVTNTDLRVNPSFFSCLLQKSWPTSVGWLCPDIREERNWPRNPFHPRRPTARWMRNRVRLLSSSWLTVPYVKASQWKRAWMPPPPVPSESRAIYAGHGSLMVLHRKFFQKGGTLRFGGFLYGEEIHLAEQMNRLGLKVQWTPSLRAMHQGAGVLEQIPITRRRIWWEESYRYLRNLYFES